ncbi:hypothetical protein EB241_01220 [Erwinia psidii]|uniref:Uncharacterized protein n=2 Tax=Erwinia psidii TaxID=69224 RepID=A0A3N6SJ44_9GAMM|nr:hypothetical protein EB241_01220 [Erwinia psidii]
MSAEAYSQYKASMNSRETEPRRVHFRDDVLLKTEDDSGVISTPPKEAPRISALYDDDTDYVLFDEFEPFRQKLIKSKEGSSPSGKSDFSPTSNQPEKNCSLAEQEKLTTYDIPRGNPVPAIYDIPKKI